MHVILFRTSCFIKYGTAINIHVVASFGRLLTGYYYVSSWICLHPSNLFNLQFDHPHMLSDWLQNLNIQHCLLLM